MIYILQPRATTAAEMSLFMGNETTGYEEYALGTKC